jgi:hypothetical protein
MGAYASSLMCTLESKEPKSTCDIKVQFESQPSRTHKRKKRTDGPHRGYERKDKRVSIRPAIHCKNSALDELNEHESPQFVKFPSAYEALLWNSLGVATGMAIITARQSLNDGLTSGMSNPRK